MDTHQGAHTHTHTRTASRLSDVSWLRSEKSSADISERRGEAAAQRRLSEKQSSVKAVKRKTWRCIIASPSEAAFRVEERNFFSHENVKCSQNFSVHALKDSLL